MTLAGTIPLRPGLLRIAANTAWLSSDRLVRMAVNVFIGAWFARYLGPDLFGAFNYAFAFVALAAPIAGMGLDNIIVRDLVRDPQSERVLLGTGFVLKLVGNLALILLVMGAAWIVNVRDRQILLMIFIAAIANLFTAADVVDFYYQARVRAKYSVIARNAAFFAITVLKIIFLLKHASVIAFAWITVVEAGLSAVALIIVYSTTDRHIFEWRAQWGCARQLLRDAWPLMFSGLVIMIYMRIDLLMLGQMLNEEAVGKYAAAERVSELWLFVPMAICASLAPNIIKTRDINPSLYLRRIQQLFVLMVALSYAVAIGVTLLGHWIMWILYGAKYLSATSILLIHIWTGVFVSLGVARQPWLLAEGLLMFSMISTSVGALVNVLLNLLLIPRYGGAGAAVATLVAQFTAVTLMMLASKATRKLLPMQLRALALNFGKFR
jgi:PST family polysaccharide transporter